ncbi:TfuA-like protein [Roseovarius sp. THAF8]|uniref:TfuA-like protein n=1 Tax=Roseovarius sp. THAF8 TaxID=2587846 RepID=UPI00126875AE|nr:TfuA-like protein [Roseovarius sp. THAF8]QFT96898.1 TfuA-like protein [Roseovarius sp. THAF8]
MTPVIFAGPTIAAQDIRTVLDAEVLPPVAQGDVYRAARRRPPAIGIIDGYFEGVPSVWHKEILWALEQGIPVFGSASMGALRAAELHDFGMIGVGAIFESYLQGEIADDDEVAVLHGPAELGFVALSEPMVSVRATVKRAISAQVLTPDAAALLTETAKSLHYKTRTWDEISARLLHEPGLAAFFAWLPDGKVDAKGDDARSMLDRMATFLESDARSDGTEAQRVERTLVWQGLVRRIEEEGETGTAAAGAVLDELRLDPERYEATRDRAMLRSLALENAARRGAQADRDTLRAVMDSHRRRNTLARRDALLTWLDANDLDGQSYETLLTEAALIEDTRAARSPGLDAHILSELRWTGAYAKLKHRAEAKARTTAEESGPQASPDRLRLLVWFFETRLGRAVPDDPDAFARSLGLEGRDELIALIAREFRYNPDEGDTQSAGSRG